MADDRQNAWCIVHGTPGRDPLSVEGPFDTEQEAREKAARCVEARPDIAAIVDRLVHPESVRFASNIHSDEPDPDKRPQTEVLTLVGEVKHASYDPPRKELVDRLNELVQAHEQHLDGRVDPVEQERRKQLLAPASEPALAPDGSTGSPLDHRLRELGQRLVVTHERLRRLTEAYREG